MLTYNPFRVMISSDRTDLVATAHGDKKILEKRRKLELTKNGENGILGKDLQSVLNELKVMNEKLYEDL